jgi:serine/threonine protein kinase
MEIETHNNLKLEIIIPLDSNSETCAYGKMFHRISEYGLNVYDIPSLSDFVYTETIGEGSVSKFYSAIEKKSGARCGIKEISKSIWKKINFTFEQMEELFHKEVSIHTLQDNPYIIKLYGCFEDHDNYYLILELGITDLYYKFTAKDHKFAPLDETIALKYMKMVALGLKNIHQHGIIHKDIKLENFIYCNDIIKICDFGLAEYKDSQRFLNSGTPQYRAPELIYSPATEKSDLYALGTALYILTHCAFPKDLRFKFYKHITPKFKELLKSMLNTDLEKRITVDDFLEHPLVASVNL